VTEPVEDTTKDRFETFLDRHFEQPFFKMRYFALLAVIFSLVGSLFMMFVGAYDVVACIWTYLTAHDAIELELGLVKSLDVFLFALVMMIFSMGLYDLFISKLEPAHVSGARPNWIRFKNIDQLKTTLTKVIVIILIITFFELIMKHASSFTHFYEFLVIPLGVLLIATALRLFHGAE